MDIPEMTPKRCKVHPDLIPEYVLLKGHLRYAKWICSDKDCAKWITWARDPKTNKNIRKRRADIVDFLLENCSKQLPQEDLTKLLDYYGKGSIKMIAELDLKRILNLTDIGCMPIPDLPEIPASASKASKASTSKATGSMRRSSSTGEIWSPNLPVIPDLA